MPIALREDLATSALADFESKLVSSPFKVGVVMHVFASDGNPSHDEVLVEKWQFTIS